MACAATVTQTVPGSRASTAASATVAVAVVDVEDVVTKEGAHALPVTIATTTLALGTFGMLCIVSALTNGCVQRAPKAGRQRLGRDHW